MKQDIIFNHNSFIKFQNPYICLQSIGWEKCLSSHSNIRNADTYIIHFVKSGRGTLYLNDEVYELCENDAFLIRPNEIAKYIADEEDPWHYGYFAFSGVLIAYLLEDTVFKDNISVYSMKDDKIMQIIMQGIDEISCTNSVSISSLEYLMKFLSVMISEDVSKTDDTNVILKQVENYIKQNLTRDIKINEIAEVFNLSRSYLFRLFKENYGVSPKTYISNFRLQEAKGLLVNTELSFNEISEMLGYKNYSVFFKMFKTNTGKTPREYRLIKKDTNYNESVSKLPNGMYSLISHEDSIVFSNRNKIKI